MRLVKFLALAALVGLLSHDGTAQAAATLTVTGPANVTAGATATLTVTLAGSSGLNLTGVQWTHALPVGATLGTPVISPAFAVLGKGAYCGATVCLAVGLAGTVITNTPLTDGAIMTVPVTFASGATLGAASMQINGTFSANSSGAAVTITPGATYSITVLPGRCDVNGDGKVDSTDVNLVVQAVTGKGSCPLSGGCTLQSLVAVILAALGGSCTL